jgi:hypothetical protein
VEVVTRARKDPAVGVLVILALVAALIVAPSVAATLILVHKQMEQQHADKPMSKVTR